MDDCEHTYHFMGVVYSFGDQRPGSSAYDRVYEDKFFCAKCLNVRYENKRIVGHSYEKPLAGSFPK